ncbi:MAG: hypothetical protein KF770_28865 [Anaerolineae bacterium]|nr:hypothetical protein [Anaerolineae bacterium]
MERRWRFPIMALVMAALLAGLWAGLLRLGWGWPVLRPLLPSLHGPLMVSGFLGTLICLERAVALGTVSGNRLSVNGNRWLVGAVATGVGALWLVVGLPVVVGQVLVLLGSGWLTAVSLFIYHQHRTLYTAVMGVGALCWLLGNGLWLAGWPVHRLVVWWAAFLVLTIVGERLELSRVQRLSRASFWLFGAATAVYGAGLLLSLAAADVGIRLNSLGALALAAWLLRYDIARRTARQPAITGYIGRNLLAGYGWLVVSGLAGLVWGQLVAGPRYDLWLHALFLGFAFSMIFAHALIIFPAITGWPVAYHAGFYMPALLLQASLLLRVAADWYMRNPALRQWGGLLNAIAILLFFGMVAVGLVRGRRSH